MRILANLITLTGLYPGGKWMKRVRHLSTMFLVVFSVFLNDIQNTLLEAGDELISWSVDKTEVTVSNAHYLGQKITPYLKKIQQSQYGWLIENLGLTSESLEENLHQMNSYQKQLKSYGTMVKLAALLLRLTSLLFWAFIVVSFSWLLCDLYLGHAKLFVSVGLACAVIFNIFIYYWFLKNFGNSISQF